MHMSNVGINNCGLINESLIVSSDFQFRSYRTYDELKTSTESGRLGDRIWKFEEEKVPIVVL